MLPEIVARRSWSYRLISKAMAPAPRYGSATWLALPEGSPAKIAAVVVAAECWAVDFDDLPTRLELEVTHLREAFKADEDAEYVARAEAHRRTAPRFSSRSFAERRAEQLAATSTRPGDFPGQRGVRQ